MAKLGEVTIPVNFEITETSKQVLKSLIAEVLKEALVGAGEEVGGDPIHALKHYIRDEIADLLYEASKSAYPVFPIATVDALKVFIRQEVSDLLSETFPGSSEQSQQGE